MMNFFLTLVILFSTFAQADSGLVLKLMGQKDGHLLRNGKKMSLEANMTLKMGDEIFSQENVVLIYLKPNLQISLSNNAHIKLNKSVTELMKGLIRVRIDKVNNQENDHKIQSRDVVVAIDEAEFEFMIAGSKDVELDVFQGEIAVSSPYVHSFVPEIIKSQGGITFRYDKKAFLRRKVQSRFKNYPVFQNKGDMNKILKDRKR